MWKSNCSNLGKPNFYNEWKSNCSNLFMKLVFLVKPFNSHNEEQDSINPLLHIFLFINCFLKTPKYLIHYLLTIFLHLLCLKAKN